MDKIKSCKIKEIPQTEVWEKNSKEKAKKKERKCVKALIKELFMVRKKQKISNGKR